MRKVKSWRGAWHSYSVDTDGVEHRHNHTRTLGLKSEMTTDEAKRKLRDIIDREASQAGKFRPNPEVTFEWFWKNNYVHMKKGEWSEATRSAVESVVKNHVLPALGSVKLGDISKLALQTHLYDVADQWSESVAKEGSGVRKGCAGRSRGSGPPREESGSKNSYWQDKETHQAKLHTG